MNKDCEILFTYTLISLEKIYHAEFNSVCMPSHRQLGNLAGAFDLYHFVATEQLLFPTILYESFHLYTGAKIRVQQTHAL